MMLVQIFVILFQIGWIFGNEAGHVQDSTNLSNVADDLPLLLLATLDGSLYGINYKSGKIKWKLNNEPAVKVPVSSKSSDFPVILPDPKDGSLYLLDFGESNLLKKMPFSMQELVAASPCRSNDGIFYSGKKLDSWFSINKRTGKKLPMFGFDQESSCPIPSSKENLLIGRTEYKIIMYDSKNVNSYWNVTYYDYSSQMLSHDEMNSYAYLHVSGSSSGKVKTLDRLTGTVLWEIDVGSPLVALYISRGQDIYSVPFKSVADPILESLPFFSTAMYSTLYIGEHIHGLYAFPSLVDSNTRVLPNYRPPMLLIDGPFIQATQNAITLGHYQLPDTSKTQLQIAGRSDPVIVVNSTEVNATRKTSLKKDSDTKHEHLDNQWVGTHSTEHRLLLAAVFVLLVSVVAMFIYFSSKVRDIQLSSQGSSSGSGRRSESAEVQQGIISVGKISFNTQNILGKGCEGTFVFQGEFDGRQVAVKRVLPDCFSLADREVALLRESDTHPNVIRYFCTESDFQFYYIALELASATLQDYVEKGVHKEDIEKNEVLKQATSGLDHLHSLQIVHRDIKPHNILLSKREQKVRAMISDFGLCKKLQNGRVSFSRRSGVTGTDGWIAPEMIESTGRTMCAVDIFSLGCVFYYVQSGGKHPFGETLRRQANILAGEYRLNFLDNDLWQNLINSMLSKDPLKRPPCSVIKMHPVFWDNIHILAFLQDVSDRMEKENNESLPLNYLEKGGSDVCGEDWRSSIDAAVSMDLRKYRSYRGDSVRDLLRALRNKKHHFRELSEEAQDLLGPSADSFVTYWTSRFPRLLYHTWISLQPLRLEPAFSKYYTSFEFDCVKGSDLPAWLTDSDETEKTSPLKQRKKQQPKEGGEVVEEGRENWIKTGRENGAWRPRLGRNRPRYRQDKVLVELPP